MRFHFLQYHCQIYIRVIHQWNDTLIYWLIHNQVLLIFPGIPCYGISIWFGNSANTLTRATIATAMNNITTTTVRHKRFVSKRFNKDQGKYQYWGDKMWHNKSLVYDFHSNFIVSCLSFTWIIQQYSAIPGKRKIALTLHMHTLL